MMFRVLTAVSILAVSACDAPSNGVATSTTTTSNAPATTSNAPAQVNPNLTRAQIETCWLQAGLQGDIYKLLTPAEV